MKGHCDVRISGGFNFPESADNNLLIIFKRVDLPLPENPATPRVSPSSTEKLMLSKTFLLSNVLLNFVLLWSFYFPESLYLGFLDIAGDILKSAF